MKIRAEIAGRGAVLAAGDDLAVAAGLRMLAQGGNAIDAAVAAGFAQAVTRPFDLGWGGDASMLVYAPSDRRVVAVSGRGRTPQEMTPDALSRHGLRAVPANGPLAAAVPGLPGALFTALLRFGTLPLHVALEPAAQLAQGFPADARLCARIGQNAPAWRRAWPATADLWLPGDALPAAGQILQNPQLHAMITRISTASRSQSDRAKGILAAMDLFYRTIAVEAIEQAARMPMPDSTGELRVPLLSAADFAGYRTRLESAISADCRDMTLYVPGAWSRGAALLEQMRLLAGMDWKGVAAGSPTCLHRLIETAKIAAADGEAALGDPQFTKAAIDWLYADSHIQERLKLITDSRALPIAETAFLPEAPTDVSPLPAAPGMLPAGDGAAVAAVDRDGRMAALAAGGGTIDASPILPELGFALGTSAAGMSFLPDHPNCVAGAKRPLSPHVPVIGFYRGAPWMAMAAEGCPDPVQLMARILLGLSEFGESLAQAQRAAPVIAQSAAPRGAAWCEAGLKMDALVSLQNRGHCIRPAAEGALGHAAAALVDQGTGWLYGAAARRDGAREAAMGWL